MSTIDIYTDGGCNTISGIGGWATMIYDGPRPVEISGYETDTTNQKMELRAAIERLEYLAQPSQVRLYSDSAYECGFRRTAAGLLHLNKWDEDRYLPRTLIFHALR